MDKRFIVGGQRVDPALTERARQFRRAMTPAERLLWQELRGRRLGGLRFRRQQIVAGYVADFYCHEAGLVVEVDGPIHDEQQSQDAYRDAVIASEGLRIIRVTNYAVLHQLESVLTRIAAAATKQN